MDTVQKQLACASVKQCLVQILVVVATIQLRFLKTEVEKGSMTTAVGHGLVGPKDIEKSFDGGFTPVPKGNRVNIPEPWVRYCAVTQMNSRTQWKLSESVVSASNNQWPRNRITRRKGVMIGIAFRY